MRGLRVAAAIWIAFCAIGAARAAGENRAEKSAEKPAEELYLNLGGVGLDATRVYQVRGASLDRSAVHITLDDGTIAFTQDVMGRITGAFFEGEGEVLLTPPNDVERRSMSLFTGMAILEEHFATAYFRFNDDAAAEMMPDLRATENKEAFVQRWGATATNLASADATRLLITFSRMLPVSGPTSSEPTVQTESPPGRAKDQFLHVRLQGTKLGVFDVYYDSEAAEQVEVGQAKAAANGDLYYDVWTSFSPLDAGPAKRNSDKTGSPEKRVAEQSGVKVRRYTMKIEVQPPTQIHARARMECEVTAEGSRTLLFELSRFLQIESVKLDGQAVEFIHNPAVEGTQLSRRGNDLVTVILPQPGRYGQKVDLEFVYGGEVLADAGNGLLYVGARGTWYPNRGVAMADFDLEFEYPPGWMLVATGKPTAVSLDGTGATGHSQEALTRGQQTSRWVSERPIPLAGFNLGRYKLATTQAGDVTVETYATSGMERGFPSAPIHVIEANPNEPGARRGELLVPNQPSPAQTESTVGAAAAQAIRYYAERFGPYPYSRLAITQMPGLDSQGWPGLIFLSSYAFLDQQQREQLHYEPYRILLQEAIPAHETAHQWWGDLITWSTYRDQWISEGLANYCALMMLQEKDPAGFRQVMEKYRTDLIEKNKDGVAPMDAGPVTLGARLLSSRFPEGYEAILYGRGTWLFHMLRSMMKEAAAQGAGRREQSGGSVEEPFVRALRKVRQRYEGKSISTSELVDVFAEELPPSLRYEGKSSLNWFLEGWINGTSMPKLELKVVKFTPQGKGTVVSGTILQKDSPEDLVTSVPIYAISVGKPPVLLGRVFADGAESQFRLSAPPGTHKVVLDPNETILRIPK